MTFAEYVRENRDTIVHLFVQHVNITVKAVFFSIIVGVLIGVLISKYEKLAWPVINVANVIYTIPSLALFALMIPILGIGKFPAIVALVLYNQIVLVRNTYVGIKGVESAVLESAVGMGMSPAQVLFRVQLPLAFPVIMAGIRTAAVITVATATIAATIGAGGLGLLIFGGISSLSTFQILAGAIPTMILANAADWLLYGVEVLVQRKWGS
ncbi:Binding-protein-dependent transport system inner membrane component [Acididesulfobacillus acetoxydans]|uniref:Binding-protein-dependent transport system inner membrane component n=1 Tax=Acididesulfobacillus acetoxydans TaxID=1561005 RepID=A0A8S0W2V2_9FIRM|nr:ABC transporter permease [Acididesulfobacillus acetoxydans]CAA7601038.1 Binding-protein-dependent transport system inner membrane component [Acididesulfobacillus acetoxydans]CEJ06912.1 Binding-protein-dependent transport systems inner membrane component [Acididesulfobacillus acetoxydans]